jgi:hypothetical protein
VSILKPKTPIVEEAETPKPETPKPEPIFDYKKELLRREHSMERIKTVPLDEGVILSTSGKPTVKKLSSQRSSEDLSRLASRL